MERSIDDVARDLVRYNRDQYMHLMDKASKAHQAGDMAGYTRYREAAINAVQRIDDLRGLTDEGVR